MLMPDVRVQDIDLYLQLGLIFLLAYGYWQIRTKRTMKKHAWLFALITLINLVSVIVVMVPLFLAEFGEIVASPMTVHSILMWIHHLLGLLAVILSVYILVKWRSNATKGRKCGGKGIMNVTFFSWLLSAILGALLYIIESR